jgi:hypothetical protein
LLAGDVAFCAFTYDEPGGSSLRTGVVRLSVRIERNGELIRLYQQVHVSNVP